MKNLLITNCKSIGLWLKICVLIVGFSVFFVVLAFSLHAFGVFALSLQLKT